MAGPGAEAWCAAALGAAERLGIPLAPGIVGGAELGDPDGRFAEAYGVSATGAVIVRPDGIVAWRAADATDVSPDAIEAVLGSLVCRRDPSLRYG
jgi:putative polyketide hydroxylase